MEFRLSVNFEPELAVVSRQTQQIGNASRSCVSTDRAAIEMITSRQWDCIYIDGNHDYEVVKADWTVCAASVRPNGLIVLDDAGLDTTFQPPIFATKGHPGPSRVALEIDRSQFQEILQVGHNRVFKKLPAT